MLKFTKAQDASVCPEARASWSYFAWFTLIVLFVGAVLCATGATAQRIWPGDAPILLDGSWRILQGQVPHADFHTPLGPLTFLVVAFGMWLAGPCGSAIAYGNVLVFIIIALWAWALSRDRLPGRLGFLFAIYVSLIVAGTSVHGFPFWLTGYACIFNRYGAALTALIFLELFGRPSPRGTGIVSESTPKWSHAPSFLGGLSTGVALALLLFLKLNFFGVAAVGVVTGAIVCAYDRRRWVGLVLGALLVTGVMLACLRFNVLAFIRDMHTGIVVRTDSLFAPFEPAWREKIWNSTPDMLVTITLLIALWWITPVPPSSSHARLNPRIEQAVILLCLIVAQLMLFLTCSGGFLPSLFPLAAMLLLQARPNGAGRDMEAATPPVNPHPALTTSRRTPLAPCPSEVVAASHRRVSYVLAAVQFALLASSSIASITYSTYDHFVAAPGRVSERRYEARPLADMAVPRHPWFVAQINDGLALLRGHSRPADRILAMDFTNFFSFGLGYSSPRGDALWWDHHATFNRQDHPDPEKTFADVSVVMWPKHPVNQAIVNLMMSLYGDTLTRYFSPVAESEHWILYRRKF